MAASVADCITLTLEALETLAGTAEPIEDEFQYVADLGTVWRGRLATVRDARGEEPASAGAEAAVEALVAEANLITDPHRAIDWLSTLPQVALAALGEAA
jgi:hypothetical protein